MSCNAAQPTNEISVKGNSTDEDSMTGANTGKTKWWSGIPTVAGIVLFVLLCLWLFTACVSAINGSDEKPATGDTRVVEYSESKCHQLRFDMLNDANSTRTKNNAAIEYEKYC